MFEDSNAWANRLFDGIEVSDGRLKNRLIKTVQLMSNNPGIAINRTDGGGAKIEGAYRLIRNPRIPAEVIAKAGFKNTAKLVDDYDVLLALEDTTTLSFNHSTVFDEMGSTASKKMKHAKGILVHSVLLHDPNSGVPVGLVYQNRWQRGAIKAELEQDAENEHTHTSTTVENKKKPKKDPKEKESFKWQEASENISALLEDKMDKVISVCDREADFLDYIKYKVEHNQRFVVRSSHDRKIYVGEGKELLHQFTKQMTPADNHSVFIQQRGGRKARHATCAVSYSTVEMNTSGHSKLKLISLNYIRAEEILTKEQIKAGKTERLCWHILTSEPIEKASDANKILHYYEQRWMIEKFHHAWKSGGTEVEKSRMQSKVNLDKMIVLSAFIAVRIHQLKTICSIEENKNKPAEILLSAEAIEVLKMEVGRGKFDKFTINWAYQAIGKLVYWKDTKRTGIVGWKILWEGWIMLERLIHFHRSLKLKNKL